MSPITLIFALGALFLAIKTVGVDEPVPRTLFSVTSWVCAGVTVVLLLVGG